MSKVHGLIERQCFSCGKLLYPTQDWVYKLKKGNNLHWFCSYKCWRKNGGRKC